MSELEFAFRDLLTEIDAMDRVAEKFIAPESRGVLPALKGTLEDIRDSRSRRTAPWGIADSNPLKTVVSRARDSDHVFAEITSVWEISCVVDREGQRLRPNRFALAGKASTRVRLRSAQNNDELAMWRMEVGDAASPGCHFHVQVMGEADHGPFPRRLSVPRLPAIHATPPAVLEFVLGELFQDEWEQELAHRGPDLQRWAPIRRQWLGRLLQWQLSLVQKTPGSPWVALKRTKPASDLFVEAR